jgi:hypothetical protein
MTRYFPHFAPPIFIFVERCLPGKRGLLAVQTIWAHQICTDPPLQWRGDLPPAAVKRCPDDDHGLSSYKRIYDRVISSRTSPYIYILANDSSVGYNQPDIQIGRFITAKV